MEQKQHYTGLTDKEVNDSREMVRIFSHHPRKILYGNSFLKNLKTRSSSSL